MLSEDLKDRLKRHITEDFETSMTDSEEVSDGIGDSISAGLTEFEAEINLLSEDDQTLFYDYVDEVLQDLIEEWEDQQEEDEEEDE